jgi:hypothetical protein
MYAFQARFPINHVVDLVQKIRSGDYERGDMLMLTGAITGELGALLKGGFDVGLMADVEVPSTIDGCVTSLSVLETQASDADAAFDPSVLIPIVLKLIELWLARKGK